MGIHSCPHLAARGRQRETEGGSGDGQGEGSIGGARVGGGTQEGRWRQRAEGGDKGGR